MVLIPSTTSLSCLGEPTSLLITIKNINQDNIVDKYQVQKLMIDYLTDASMTTVTSREGYMSWGV